MITVKNCVHSTMTSKTSTIIGLVHRTDQYQRPVLEERLARILPSGKLSTVKANLTRYELGQKPLPEPAHFQAKT